MASNSQGTPPNIPKDGRLPTKAEVEHIIANHPELQKPIFFPNHQKQFVAFTWIACFAMTVYFVFWHDFPMEEHCFSPLRRFTKRWKDKFFAVDESESEALKERIQELKDKLEAKKAGEGSLTEQAAAAAFKTSP